jgi:hypothetical protein
MEVDRNLFNENGYLIIRNVFTQIEISNLRNLAYESLEVDKLNDRVVRGTKTFAEPDKDVYYTTGDFLIKPMYKLLLDPRILEIAKTILDGQPVHFGESNYQIGLGDRGFHRDGVDRIYPIGSDWEDDYKIIRVGVYLQDHDKCSGGLKVQKGSHRKAKGKRILLDSKAGDVVVWDLRTFHSGNSVRMKFFPNLPLGYRIENILPKYLIHEENVERIGCFMVFGVHNKHLEKHIEKHYRVKFKEYIRVQKYEEDIIRECKKAGLHIIIPKLTDIS